METLIILLFIIAFIILAPRWIVKINDSSCLKKWQKDLVCCCIIGFGCLAPIGTMIIEMESREREPVLICSRNPKDAIEYIKNIDINIVLPDFMIGGHTLQSIGSDALEERWEIKFKRPLTESFMSRLDSLCNADSLHWSRGWQRVGHGMASEEMEMYTFSYWNPVMIGFKETVMINPVWNSATFIHKQFKKSRKSTQCHWQDFT